MSGALTVAAVLVLLTVTQLFLQKEAPVYAALLSTGGALFLLLRLSDTVQLLIRNVSLLGQQVDGQAFCCLLRCAGILLLTDYVRTFCGEAGADSLGWCAGLAGRCLVLTAAGPLLETLCRQIWALGG